MIVYIYPMTGEFSRILHRLSHIVDTLHYKKKEH